MIRAIYNWTLIAISTIFFGITASLVCFFAPGVVLRFVVRPWAKSILKICGVKVEVDGLENLPSEPVVIMFNHQSYFDIFAYASVLPIDWRAIMKAELVWIPFFGWVAKATGHHFIKRESSIKSLREIEGIADKIRNGPSVVLAPEGTRSADGKLMPFKPGGFLLAIRSGVPVVPMVVMGGSRIMPSGSLRVYPGTIRVMILPPIDVGELPQGKEGREALSTMVRESMENVLGNESTVSEAV